MKKTPIEIALERAKAKGMNQSELAAALSTTSAVVTNWKKRGLPPEWYERMCDLLGIGLDELLSRTPGEREISLALGGLLPSSQGYTPVNLPELVAWEEIVKMDVLPRVFRLSMPDDSLSGHIERGTELVFMRDIPAAPGKTVLIRDKDGNRLIRIYAAVRGEHWQAQSRNLAYVHLNSEEHGLEVLAVMKWREG